MSHSTSPRLKLVGHWSPATRPGDHMLPLAESTADAGRLSQASPPASLQPDAAPPVDRFDPRWVLAVRTSERLQGSLLAPESREALIRLGRVLGLSAFDSNLVIAIVQDQARRGHAPIDCPGASAAQLSMISLAAAPDAAPMNRRRRALMVSMAIAALLAIEVLIVIALLRG